MRCPNCGTENLEEAKFCLKCGSSFAAIESGEVLQNTPVQPDQKVLPKGNGVLILILGILGLVFCPPTGIAAWIMGQHELKKIKSGQVSNQDEGLTRAGKILGIISTVYFILITILITIYIIAIVFFAMGDGEFWNL